MEEMKKFYDRLYYSMWDSIKSLEEFKGTLEEGAKKQQVMEVIE